MEYLAMIGAAADMVISMVGFADDLRRRGLSEDEAKQALAQAYKIDIPKIEEILMVAEQQGITPDVARGETRKNQMKALGQLEDMGEKQGMDEGSIAAIQQAGDYAARQGRAQELGIMQGAQRRGTLDSGTQLGAQLQSAQAATNTLAMAGTQAAADARIRALQAINSAGRLSGDIRSEDEKVDMFNRQAQNERDRFNTSLRQAANEHNANAPLAIAGVEVARQGQINTAMSNRIKSLEPPKDDPYEKAGKKVNAFGGGMGGMMGGMGGGGG